MQQNILIKIGKNFKKFREKTGKSLTKFAYENDLDKALLSRLENGLANPTVKSLEKISIALNIKIEDFFLD